MILSFTENNRLTYHYINNIVPILKVNEKEVELVEDYKLNPLDNLNIHTIGTYDIKYKINDDQYLIDVYNERTSNSTSFTYTIKEPEIVEIIKEVYIESKPISSNNPSNNNADSNYINGIKDIDIKLDSELNELNYLLSKDINTNMQITIDYSNVNLSSIGTYIVYYYTKDNIYSCNVNVY